MLKEMIAPQNAAVDAPAGALVANPLGTPAEIVVRAENLSKRYKIYASPWDRVGEWMSGGKRVSHQDFWALRDINFTLTRGQSLGIIGVNGSGKSTLLRILTRCLYATGGTFDIQGRILSLLELGTGVNPLLTGRQNVINSSRLLALPPGYAQDKMPQIEAFAELGEFFDRPMRVYSTGMSMRLAFSMFVAFDPDVFIVDEALSVGDIFFQQKCARRLAELRGRGTTLLFVSHDMGAIESYCDQVLVLHQGRQEHLGDKIKGIQLYYAISGATAGRIDAAGSEKPSPRAETIAAPRQMVLEGGSAGARDRQQPALAPLDETELANLPWFAPDETDRVGDDSVRIDGICLRRDDGEFTTMAEQGRDLDIFMRMRAVRDVGPTACGMYLFDRFEHVTFAQGWLNVDIDPIWLEKGDTVYACFRVRLDLEIGEEFVLSLGASQPLSDAQSTTGWNQSAGGQRHILLPRSARITILPRSDRNRFWFGPANLRTHHQWKVVKPAPGNS